MSWTLEFSKDADKFLNKQQHIKNDLIDTRCVLCDLCVRTLLLFQLLHVTIGKGILRESIPMHKELKKGLEAKLLKRLLED